MNATVATQIETERTTKLGLNNSVFGVASRAVSGFSRAGILLFIASKYGPALFGKLALAMSVMEIFRVFSEFGIDTIAIRRFTQESERERTGLLSRIVTSKLAAAAICYLIALLVTGLVAGDSLALVLGIVASLSLFSANLVGAFTSYYQSQLRMSEAFPATLFAYGLYIAASILAVVQHLPIVLVVAILPVCELLNFFVLKRKVRGVPPFRFDLSGTLSLFRESWPLGVMAAMVMLYVRLDNILIFKFVGSAALGLYAAGFRIVEPALMVPHAFSISLFTILASRGHEKTSRGRLVSAVLRTMWPAYLFVLGAAGVLVGAGQTVLRHFGSGYIGAYPALRILSAVLFFRTVNITLTAILNSRAKYSLLAKITATNLGLNLVLALLLIPRFGIEGAAWAAFGTELWNMMAQASFALGSSSYNASPVYGLVCPEPECE
jgi:O-antigen/teichoic acid export membrane protein